MNIIHRLLLAFIFTPVFIEAAPSLNAVILPGRPSAILLIAALFYFGYKWRAR